MIQFCPHCGSKVEPNAVYCLQCGIKLPTGVSKKPIREERYPRQPVRHPLPTTPPRHIPQRYTPKPFHPTMQASLGDRCFALLIDNCISACISLVSCMVCCVPLGFFYDFIKDGIREGQSLGKGSMNLRVVDFQTGRPATIGQSMIRNCLCGSCDSGTCYCFAIFDNNSRRRLGDIIAGTVVIKDY
jgi:hypothetical protein